MTISAKQALLQELLVEDGSGAQLIQRIAQKTNNKIRIKKSSVYKLLHDIQREGFIESYRGQPSAKRGGRAPTLYRLTGLGRKVAYQEQDTAALVFGLLRPNLQLGLR